MKQTRIRVYYIMNSMLNKINNRIRNNKLLSGLRDVRTIGLIAFAVIVVLVTMSGAKVIRANKDLENQVEVMRAQTEIQQLQNDNLALKNKYLQTDDYLELSARKHFNKAAPGEKLVIVPSKVIDARTANFQKPDIIQPGPIDKTQLGPWYDRTFNAWLDTVR